MSEIRYVTASDDSELSQILKLQKANLPSSLSEKEKLSEGFLTVSHTLELLKAMNEKCPHILAKSGSNVVGYALCMHPDFRNDIDVLRPMFRQIDNLLSPDESYMIMGQICVTKSHRKQGIFRGLYQKMRESNLTEFSRIITEVDEKNQRSLFAHYAVGFQDLCQYNSDGKDWFLLFLK
ncbi:MAG: GNAT family N-acetyltransferase [Eudoraea sp.]|nr:GNAT family N-acetyltransferase [Eudoraea sp.]NNK31156.1 GNAT family N-acetyltransferase [Flavobacteriaceae bacterium]